MAAIAETVRILKQDTVEATKALLVQTAKREHAKIMAADPAPQSFVRIVDGIVGAAEDRARPDGIIIYQYRRLDEVVEFAMETLFDLSPVLSGEYRLSHTIMVDGIAERNLKHWKPGSEISIMNQLPYSRKIEVGKMKMRVSGTSRVYQRALRKIMDRFGNLVTVRFTYRSARGAPTKGADRDSYRFPTLVIRER